MTENLAKYIDSTLLKPQAKREDVETLCTEAREYSFACVCVHPCHTELVKGLLAGSGVKTATVVGFPFGANTTEVKAFEAADAVKRGAEELDMVINVGALRDGDDAYVERDIKAVVDAAGNIPVKVIIETFLLTDEEKARASQAASRAGAAYVKTCTGFSGGGASVGDIEIMKANIAPGVKLKAAGGIRTREAAVALINAGASRIGTSAGAKIAAK